MNTAAPYVTPAGRRRLANRLCAAHTAYKEVVATNSDAAESGDTSVWHDNFAYEENQRLMHQLARRVHDLSALVDSVRVLDVPQEGVVEIGSRVRFVDVHSAESTRAETIVIAGFDDGDTAFRRVSYTAPLAAQMLGAVVGEERTIKVGSREREIVILAATIASEEFV